MQNKKAFEWLAQKKYKKKKIESITQEGPLKENEETIRRPSKHADGNHIGETGKI